jgi:cell division protein FtsQ
VDTKRVIQKILFVTLWVVIGGGMLILLIAAMGKQKRNTCKDYTITIKGGSDKLFLSKSEITRLLKASTNGNIKGQSKSSFNLLKMEELLEENVWIKDVQLYFDNKDVLHVSVKERQPIVRIFTSGGRSFYFDEEGKAMQLSDRRTAKVPVFTGFPDKKIKNQKDSILLNDVIKTAQYINSDSFWTAQVAQIDLKPSEADESWEFEMAPVIGNHIIKLGNADNIEQKFNRLFIFYRQVLSRTGFDKYKTIDVRFAGQVIGGKSENPKVDSVQLRKNVEKLLEMIKKVEADSTTNSSVRPG